MKDDVISRKDAIDTFKDCAENGVSIDGIVDALENLPSAQPAPCEDAVSRADVVDMLEMYPFTEYGEYESAREVVRRLPSVRPETYMIPVKAILELEEIKRIVRKIKDAPVMVLPSNETNTKEHFQHVESVGCVGDTISRQAAIDEIARWIGYLDDDMIGRIQLSLKRLPSAQPEIVRCKDCKHRYIEDMIWHCPFGLMGGENFFCAYGAKKEILR